MSSNGSSSYKLTDAELAAYDSSRQQAYPTSYHQRIPTRRALDDFRDYTRKNYKADEFVRKYEDRFEAVARGRTKDPLELSRSDHILLVDPAYSASIHTTAHAQARKDYLTTHPYSYYTAQSRRDHETKAEHADLQAAHYRGRYDVHQAGSSSHSTSHLAGYSVSTPASGYSGYSASSSSDSKGAHSSDSGY